MRTRQFTLAVVLNTLCLQNWIPFIHIFKYTLQTNCFNMFIENKVLIFYDSMCQFNALIYEKIEMLSRIYFITDFSQLHEVIDCLIIDLLWFPYQKCMVMLKNVIKIKNGGQRMNIRQLDNALGPFTFVTYKHIKISEYISYCTYHTLF